MTQGPVILRKAGGRTAPKRRWSYHMMRFGRVLGAVLPIFSALFLLGCTGGLTEAEQRLNARVELQEQERLTEALAEYDEAIRLDPQFAPAYGNLGNAYAKLGQYQRAIHDCDEAIPAADRLVKWPVNKEPVFIPLWQGCHS